VVGAGHQPGVTLFPTVRVRATVAVVGCVASRAGRQEHVTIVLRAVPVPDLRASDTAHGPVIFLHGLGLVEEVISVAVAVAEDSHHEFLRIDGATHGGGDVVIVVVTGAAKVAIPPAFGQILLDKAALIVGEIGRTHLIAVRVAIILPGVVIVAAVREARDIGSSHGVQDGISPHIGNEGVNVGGGGALVCARLPLEDAVEGVRGIGAEGKGSAHVPFLIAISALSVVVIGVNAILAPAARKGKAKDQLARKRCVLEKDRRAIKATNGGYKPLPKHEGCAMPLVLTRSHEPSRRGRRTYRDPRLRRWGPSTTS